jgi:hypothetical protein
MGVCVTGVPALATNGFPIKGDAHAKSRDR